MLRALWFVIKVGLLVAAAVWVANRPGFIEAQWLGYEARIHVGIALLAGLFVIALAVFLARLLWDIGAFFRNLRRYRADRRREKGFRALTQGLTAVAAGDAKAATQSAEKAQRYLPSDKGLTVLLEAQAARLKGDDEAARGAFSRLLENRDTAFLGLRGLLLNALERHDNAQALELARRARAMHPKQPWVLRMAYELELRQRHWDEARRVLKGAVKSGAIPEDTAQADSIALSLQQAEDALQQGHENAAREKLRHAHKADPAFVPAALRLAQFYLDTNKTKGAAAVIARAWEKSPHPELADLWGRAMPVKARKDGNARLQWFERLVAMRPDSADGQLAAAEECIEQGLWGTARQYLERADELRPNARLYRLRARLAQAQERPEETSLMLRKAAEAPPDKVWTCRETGRVYDHWSPVARPHGSFNTIIWDYPRSTYHDNAASDRTELLITAPAQR